jgi:metal-dependent hydrolase (beta-lactamase superfamily II)
MEEAEQEELQAAVRDLNQINPDYILGGNCTGLRLQLEVEENLPNRFVRCFCGGEYIF